MCAAVILPDDLDDHRRSELLALMEARVNAGGVDGLSERSRPDQLLALPSTLVPRDAEGRLDRPKLRHMLAAYDQAGGLAAS